jgi:hypothetical protein
MNGYSASGGSISLRSISQSWERRKKKEREKKRNKVANN